MDLYLLCKKDIHHTINTPDFDTKRNNTHTPSTLPPNSIHRYPTMPSKVSKNLPGSLHLNRSFRWCRLQYIHPQDTILLIPQS